MRRALLQRFLEPLAASPRVLTGGGPLQSHTPPHPAAAVATAAAGAAVARFATSPPFGGSSGGDAGAHVARRREHGLLASVLAPDVLAQVLPHMPPFDVSSSSHASPPHVAVGLSGGIDSAVAAWLLKTAGYRVTGVLMRNWDEAEETGGQCSFEKDKRDARAAAQAVGIPLTEVDFVQEYWHSVFEPFLRDFDGGGATPNPDLACNRHIKFGALLHHCTAVLGADLLATGHYARVVAEVNGGAKRLLRGADPDKDQSYFLASVRGEALTRACFPLGGLTKHEVRRLAAGPAALPPAVTQRRSSAGICFIGRKRDFGDFIQEYIPPSADGGEGGGGGGGGSAAAVGGGGGGGGPRNSNEDEDAGGAAVLGAVDPRGASAGGAGASLPLPLSLSSPLAPPTTAEELDIVQKQQGRRQETGCFVSVEDGEVVGEHRGLARYTCGQRARLGGAPQPWFVVGKDARVGANTVYVAPGATHPALFTSGAAVGRCFWVGGEPPQHLLLLMDNHAGGGRGGGGSGGRGVGEGEVAVRLLAQTRYGAQAVPCTVRLVPPGAAPGLSPSRYCTPPPPTGALKEKENDGEVIEVMFDSPERAVTPGQALVLYDGDTCLGGGVVLFPAPSLHEVEARRLMTTTRS